MVSRGSPTTFSYYQRSSVWFGLKKLWPTITSNLRWLIGNGKNISFWTDNWLGEPIFAQNNLDPQFMPFLNTRVNEFIEPHRWSLPRNFQSRFPDMTNSILRIVLLEMDLEDKIIWPFTSSGVLSESAAYDFLSTSSPPIYWGSLIWQCAIQPRKSVISWKVLHGRALVDTVL